MRGILLLCLLAGCDGSCSCNFDVDSNPTRPADATEAEVALDHSVIIEPPQPTIPPGAFSNGVEVGPVRPFNKAERDRAIQLEHEE